MLRFLKWLGLLAVVLVVGTGIAFYAPDTDPAAMRAKYGGPPSQFVDLGGGLTVHLRDEGPRDAPVLVLLHGSNADLHTWDAWISRLTPQYRVIRFDQIGHGLTGPNPARDYSIAAFTGTVDRVVTKLGISRFVLAGNSMGGGIALNYARQHPEKLAGLVLVDAGGAPEPETDGKELPIGFRIALTPGVRDIMKIVTPRSMIDTSLHQSVSNQAIVTPAMVDRYWELLRYPGNRQATLDRFSTPRVATNEADVRAIKTPTLVMWGAEDKLIPVASAAWFARLLPNATRVTYPGIGHIPMEETPDRSAADLKSWLATLPAPR
jgi:pimeloyl-ACP methyl ester carboxylesterase